MFSSILVICVGNICRSPIGEGLLKLYIPKMRISSAGLGALVGQCADEKAKYVANKSGISLTEHRAKMLTADMCREYDLILVMERKHIDAITKLAPEVRGKTMLYGHWIQKEIPDPYKQSLESFEHVYKLLDDSAQKWVGALNRT
ncbi:protein tyrosine phosphatase [Gibbsiella quercinecans]|uniref:protein-tyrosine-phosphatase n=1 Tax=Gibbsiella quercinecans TaxID=929813 RepID=A0A250AXS6_9GAMM|nr:protein tyrosine phosphatase [Gibbsiella quercinecans]ATA18626.1 protein tyrosine phosphatase [Gibbsiella quercinecans]RLM14874.1 protein tyrosine phosphatase [Gibbsiella quercinecans]